MEKRLFVIKNMRDLERCYSVIKELRPHLNQADYFSIYEHAHKNDGYEIVAIENAGEVLAVMGYRILYDFVRGKHLYVDDLVSTEKARSQGLGAELLRFAEVIARESGCEALRLCTGIENAGGIRFYERLGWVKRAYAYTKKLPG